MNKFYSSLLGLALLVSTVAPAVVVALDNPTIAPTTGITTTDATLNGINGDTAADAGQEAFWYGTTATSGPFISDTEPTVSNQLPSGWTGIYATTQDLSPNGPFSYTLSGLLPSTTYYFVAWSRVAGLWSASAISNFSTLGLPQVIATTSISAKTYGDADFNPAYTGGGSGNPVTYTSVTPSVCTTPGGTVVHIVAAGTCTFNADQAAGGAFAAATQVSTTITIAKRDLNITASEIADPAKTYDGTLAPALHAITGLTFDAVVGADVVTLIPGTGTLDVKDFGVRNVTFSGYTLDVISALNYNLLNQPATETQNITPLAITMTGTSVTSKVYDKTTPATLVFAAPTLVGVIAPDVVTIDTTGAVGVFTTSNVGTNPVTVSGITLTGAQAANYSLTQPTGVTGVITPRPITVTAVQTTKVYNGNTNAPLLARATITSGSLAPGDFKLLNWAETYDNKNVGAGNKVMTPTPANVNDGNGGNNYEITYVTNTTSSITPATLSVTPLGVNKVYDGTVNATLSFSDNRVAGDVLTIAGTGHFANKHIGNGKVVTVDTVTKSGLDAGNYTMSVSGAVLVLADITPLPITVTAQANTKQYDGNTTSATLPVVSPALATGDTAVLSQTYDNKDVAGSPTKTMTPAIVITDGNSGANYTVTLVPVNAGTITAKPLTLTGTSVTSKVYDKTTTATLVFTSPALVGIVAPDVVTADTSLATGVFADSNAGTAKAVTVSGITLSGADAGNYTLTQPTGVTGDITPRPITISANTGTKVYDGGLTSPVVPTITSGSVATGDHAFTLQYYGTKSVGTNKLMNPGIDVYEDITNLPMNSNYDFTFVNDNTSVITAKVLTATTAAFTKVYDGTVDATNIPMVLTGVVGAEVVTATSTGTFPSKHVGTGLTITVTSATLGGADSANYVLPVYPLSVPGSSITARGIMVTAGSNTKVYDATTTAATIPTITLGSLATGDTAVLSEAYLNKSVGTGKTLVPMIAITDGNVTPGANYSVTLTNNTAGVITASPAATSQTVVVRAGDLDVGPTATALTNNSGKWFMYNDTTDEIDGTLGSFVTGPATAPAGIGSVQFTLGANPLDRKAMATFKFSGVSLSDIMALSFGTYSQSGVSGPTEDPYLNFNVDFTGTSGSFQRRLVFVPSVNGAVVQDVWQQWDAINAGNALWSYSGAVWPTTAVGPHAGIVGQPGTTARTWSEIMEDFPNARLLPVGGWLGVKTGNPGPTNYTSNTDNVVLSLFSTTTLTTTSTTYDFDPAAVVPPTPTPTPSGGGGGNGPISGSFGLSNGSSSNGGGLVLGVSTTSNSGNGFSGSLGTSGNPSCPVLVTESMGRGRANTPEQVSRLQFVLRTYEKADIPASEDAVFGPKTLSAVNAFQKKYASEILTPAGLTKPSGLVMRLTLKKLNAIQCAGGVSFQLTEGQKKVIEQAKAPKPVRKTIIRPTVPTVPPSNNQNTTVTTDTSPSVTPTTTPGGVKSWLSRWFGGSN